MAEIVTGTVTGIVDTAALVRDHSDIRCDISNAAHHVNDAISAASNLGQRDASAYYIAETQASTQTAKEIARSQAWTEAKVDAGFIKVAGDTALASQVVQGHIAIEAERTRGAMALQHGVLTLQIATDGNATRALMQANVIADLREKAEERHAEILELRGHNRHLEHDCGHLHNSLQANQFSSLQNQLQMMNSDLQAARQGVINLGTMVGTTQSANPVSIR